MNNFEQYLNNKIVNHCDVPTSHVSTKFPIEAFPRVIQEVVLAYHKTLNYPVDYFGTSILYSHSLAIGNTHKCEVKKDFVVSCVMYCALVGKPGTNKSHPLNFATRPVLERDEKSIEAFKLELIDFQDYQSMSKNERVGIDKKHPPIYKKFVCSDYTPEVLGEIHDFNRRGIGVVNDELAGWIKNFGRYNGGSEVETWLKIWSGQPLVIDRKSGDKIFIKEPFVSVIGGIQPGILDVLSKDGRAQNGFIDRILFAYPDEMDKSPWNDNEIDAIYSYKYSKIISRLLAIPEDTREVLTFEPGAKSLLLEWHREFTIQTNEAPDALRGILSKFDIYVPRLCLIIQLMRWACDEAEKKAIDISSLNAALMLLDYFRQTATKVNQHLNSNPIERLPENIQNWYESLPEKDFKTADAIAIGSRFTMGERNIKNYLSDATLFRRLAYGKYSKIWS